jgi:hypothetical protein
MRLQAILILSFFLLGPAWVGAKSETEIQVLKLEGTIMVLHPNSDKPTALETGSTVEKGDTITCYEKSWAIFKTRRGDRFGLDSLTVVQIEEFYDEGPDRQLLLILQKGNLFMRSQNDSSRQSFVEIHTGSVVSQLGYTKAIFHYDSDQLMLRIQYLTGDMKVIDKENEQKLKLEHSEFIWKDGTLVGDAPPAMDDLDVVNFNKFFDGDPRLEPTDNNILLPSGQ